ncbi:polymorphic toxin-type HINT domain-containing protein [Sphaerisporangium flaviroseum]
MLYDYDDDGNPTTLQGLTNYVTSTTYSKLGQVLDMTLSTGAKRVKQTNFYEEGTNRLTRSMYERETAPISVADTNFTFDPSGNITKIADTPSGQPADVQCFEQDYLQRLTEAWTATDGCASGPSQAIIGGPAPYWQSFSYDVVGNRTKEVQHGAAGDVTKSYTYAGPGKPYPHTLTSVSYQGGERDGQSDVYTYDKAGNTTERGSGRTLEWDVQGHLAKSTDPSGVSTFVYDANGDRLIRRDPTSTTLYVAGMEVRLDTKTGAKTATRYYTHAGQTIATRTSKGVTWLGADHHGSADTSVDDTAAQATTRRRFTPFGQMRGPSPSYWPGERGFVGGTIDTSTALTHLGAREYDAETGRFISVDPVFDVSNPQSWNGYAYAGNNPVTVSDPSGLWFDSPQCGSRCGAGGAKDDDRPQWSPPPPPPPTNPPHCGRWSFGCKAKNLWNQHKATIVNVTVTVVVIVGCEAATLGAGSIGCAAAGGAAGNLAGYLVSTPRDEWSAGGAFKSAAVGALLGAAGGVVAKGASAGLGKLATTAAGRSVAGAVTRTAGKAKSALGKGGGAADDAASAARWGGGKGEAARKKGAADRSAESPRARSSKRSSCENSFVAGTKVKLANGTHKPIEKIKAGDKVLATNPATGKTTAKVVLAAYSGVNYLNLVQIIVDTDGKRGNATGIVLTTEHHLFWDAKDLTWVRADQLAPADGLRTPEGRALHVITTTPYQGHPTVHDLTVDDLHTFYVLVGDQDVLVHNCDVADHPSDCNCSGSDSGSDEEASSDEVARPSLLQRLGQRYPRVSDGLVSGFSAQDSYSTYVGRYTSAVPGNVGNYLSAGGQPAAFAAGFVRGFLRSRPPRD